MNRLTKKCGDEIICNVKYCHTEFCLGDCYGCEHFKEIKTKLEHYEDLEESNRLVELPCAVGDTVWELCKCDDDKYHIFPMTVCRIVTFGSPRLLKDNEIEVWNIYAESDYCKMYKSFYDIGKTVFLTREEAEAVLKECESE